MTFNVSISGWASSTDGKNAANPEAEEKASAILAKAVEDMAAIAGVSLSGSYFFHNTGQVTLPLVKNEGSEN